MVLIYLLLVNQSEIKGCLHSSGNDWGYVKISDKVYFISHIFHVYLLYQYYAHLIKTGGK